MKWLYLSIDFFTIIIPLIFSFHPKLQFYKHFKAFFLANVLVGLAFVIWDIYFTKIGIWGFNEQYLSGIYLFNLPIEEILFFICIPYACVFTYHCLGLFYSLQWNTRYLHIMVGGLVAFCLVLGIPNLDKYYTASTFISLAFVLSVFHFILKKPYLGKLLLIYPILLIPFFIVNGLLTGSGLPQAVVWYNNAENLGFRLFTIPFEDIFYGFELILLNVYLFEYLKPKKAVLP